MKRPPTIYQLAVTSLLLTVNNLEAQALPAPDGTETFGTYYGYKRLITPPASSLENPIKLSTYADHISQNPTYPTDYMNYGIVAFAAESHNYWLNDLLGIQMDSISIAASILTNYAFTTTKENTLSGNGVTLNGPFTNNSLNKQTFDTNIALSQPNHPFAVNAGSLHLGGEVSGAGASITKTGAGVLHINNLGTYKGPTTINEGTLVVDGSLQNTSLTTMAINTTLSGSGSILSQVDNAGNIAPGSSIGALQTGQLNLLTTSALLHEYDSFAAQADLLNVNGDLNIAGGAALKLTDLAVVGKILEAHTKFTLISYAGAWNGGEFEGFSDDSEFVFGLNRWLINYDDTSAGANGGDYNSFVTLRVVPEPSAALLLIPGTLLLMPRRRVVAA